MSVDLESLHRILKHPIRRRIIRTLLEKGELAYIELMNLLEIKNTGKLNYHLKILGDLIEKNRNGKYRLTEKGHLASQLLLRFPEKKTERTPLRGGDAILLGFTGFLLVLANPGIWGLGLFGIEVAFLGVIYALIVPGGLMWWLTVRRTNSHDPYDLFKPPLVSFALLILLLILLIILDVKLPVFILSQDPEHIQMAQPFLLSFLGIGSFPFLGVGISEIIHRALEKTKFR